MPTKDDTRNPDDGRATACRRCGTCCRNGGPALHREDMERIEKGIIPLRRLYTIRPGEPVRDNVKGGIAPSASEVIKLKGQNDSWVCCLFDEKANACRAYDDRPYECRVLACWDTRKIAAVYDKDRLARRDILLGVEGLWDLVETHEQRCGYGRLRKWVDALAGTNRQRAADEILSMIKYDKHLRQLVVENGGMHPGMADFLFGRPLVETIVRFGIAVEQRGDRIILKK